MTNEKLEEANYWQSNIRQAEQRLKECVDFTTKNYAGNDEPPFIRAYNSAMAVPMELVEPIRNMLIGYYKQELEAAKELFEKM